MEESVGVCCGVVIVYTKATIIGSIYSVHLTCTDNKNTKIISNMRIDKLAIINTLNSKTLHNLINPNITHINQPNNPLRPTNPQHPPLNQHKYPTRPHNPHIKIPPSCIIPNLIIIDQCQYIHSWIPIYTYYFPPASRDLTS